MKKRPFPGILLVLLLVAAAATHAPLTAQRRVVRVTAERFSFTPSEISVAAGEEIEIRLKSNDTSHGFHVLDQGIDVTIPTRGRGETAVVFKSDTAGRFEFECSHLCGAGITSCTA